MFAAARSYHDWQDDFPKEFSTYDALHPTWFGARLHALALALELNRQGLLWQRFPETEIVRRFQGTDAAVSVEYRTALDGSYPTDPPPTGMRYDLFDPPQARNLFERLTGAEPGSLLAAGRVLALSKRILYWRDTPFEDLLATTPGTPWDAAVREEIRRARERLAFFQRELVRVQTERLADYPVPDVAGLVPVRSGLTKKTEKFTLKANTYHMPDGRVVTRFVDGRSGRVAVVHVENPAKKKPCTFASTCWGIRALF